MALDYEPLMPHEDDDEDQPDLIPPDDSPEPQDKATESPTKHVREVIISTISELLQYARNVPYPSGQLSEEIIVDNGNNSGEATFPHEDADNGSSPGKENLSGLAYLEYLWRHKGGVLCNLAATEKYAGFMVENHVLEMILANLEVPRSDEITEMCLKMLNNLTSQEGINQSVASTDGLIRAIVEQLFLDDVLCLCEIFWLLTHSLGGSESFAWVRALRPSRIIRRLVWIMDKASQEILLRRAAGLFLTILQCENGIPGILIPSLIGRGLAESLTHALKYETGILYGDSTNSERIRATIDVTLQAMEALYCLEDHFHKLSFSKEQILVISSLVRYASEIKFREIRIPAVGLLAKALADDPHHATYLSRDFHFFRGFLNTVVITRKDREAVQNVLSHILVHINEREMGSTDFLQFVSVLASKTYMIKHVLCHWTDPPSKHHGSSSSESTNATIASLRFIISILKEWTCSNGHGKLSDTGKECNSIEGDIQRLLRWCERRLQYMTGNCK
ncbi:hypothetical protein MLD38_004059 [Melastoma candidum]|uniref:Uncharacterized protein n=1 Tax=Melastoma candidum TaxID=119954 RepID=A0ACB9S4F5_9MYRT|nr:hypothetical protein MLD38_004059 [Melastoma candidum]